jgi:large subunit ribosomal protein L13
MMQNKTYQPKGNEVKRDWVLVDVKDQVLGRVSTNIVKLLMGKHKATYSQHLDSGDYVVVINSSKIRLTGLKATQKKYLGHSGHPGGFKEITFERKMKLDPTYALRHAVAGMLPENRLKDKRLKRLKIFADEKHNYSDKITGNVSEEIEKQQI